MAILVLLPITLLGYLCDQGINPLRVSLLHIVPVIFNFMADFKRHFHALLALDMPYFVDGAIRGCGVLVNDLNSVAFPPLACTLSAKTADVNK